MYRSIVCFSRLSISSRIKDIDSFINKSHKEIFNKTFLNHLQKETELHWRLKSQSEQCFVDHPTFRYKVTVMNQLEDNYMEYPCAVSLLPLKYWLVKEKNEITFFNNSVLGKSLDLIVKNKTDIFSINLSANILAECLTQIRPTGFIINYLKALNCLTCFGEVKIIENEAIFVPNHKGYPEILIEGDIDKIDCSKQICQIIKWDYLQRPVGILLPRLPVDYNKLSILGSKFIENKPLLNLNEALSDLMNLFKITDFPFTESVLDDVPRSASEFQIAQSEINKRKDFRNKCIISIDPEDAKDLDDALHIDVLPNGNYLVGIHVADVSHFVKPSTALDNEAKSRANSVYLKHKVIPMLPSVLSEQLCSLNPNEDKLGFSVLIELDKDGNVIDEQFTKSVIRTRMKLSYETANNIICNTPSPELENHESYQEISISLQLLNELAKIIRHRRSTSGAFIFNKREIKFSLDKCQMDRNMEQENITPEPVEFKIKVRGLSDFLIEEFMLLANQATAKFLFKNLQENSSSKVGALLRKHPQPSKDQKYFFNKMCSKAGLKLNLSELKNIMEKIDDLSISEPLKSISLFYATFTKMQVAEYLCAELDHRNALSLDFYQSNKSPFYHYGLNVPLYTHFTSPIRRYADIIVHRQVEAILNNQNTCSMDLETRIQDASKCNVKRFTSRRFGDKLTSLYMASYLHKYGSRLTQATVLNFSFGNFTLLLPDVGIIHACKMNELAPWALDCVDTQETPLSLAIINFKYSVNLDRFSINTIQNFPQYNFVRNKSWNKLKNCNVNNFQDNQSSNSDDSNDSEIGLNSEMNSFTKVEDDNYKNFDIQAFHPIDCMIYCSEKEINLRVEIPYPPSLEALMEDKSLIL